MNNKKMMYAIEKVIDEGLIFWNELNSRYGKMYGFARFPFTIYNTGFDSHRADDTICLIRNSVDARMITLLTAGGNNNPDIHLDDQIIEGIGGGVFMSYENFYSLIIECELDFDNVLECMKFSLKHEMGHIIDHHVSLIGKTVKDWNNMYEQGLVDSKAIGKLRKNASYINRLKWYKQYFQIPHEKRANDYVGITEEDIIADWKRTH